ncbi:MAG: hypothetical protein JWN30_748 [Bacilli bacterium]|nr:hypothetical protein [Bacilli bacterium]
MQRYFVEPGLWGKEDLQIRGDDAAHIAKVMRMSAGDTIIVCNNLGRAVQAELLEVHPGAVTARIIAEDERQSEPDKCQLTLVQALPKGDKLEYIVQKGTEIGVNKFALMETERTIVQYGSSKAERKLERLRKIAKEAAEQSHRRRIPVIEPPKPFSRFVSSVSEFDAVFLCYEGQGLPGLRSTLSPFAAKLNTGSAAALQTPLSIAICIGPEGGLSVAEVSHAQTAPNVFVVTLGQRVLRTETAGIVAAAVILYELGEMGG